MTFRRITVFAIVLVCLAASGVLLFAATRQRAAASAAHAAAPAKAGKDEVASTHIDPEMSKICAETCAAPPGVDAAKIVAQPGDIHDGQFTTCPVSGEVFEVDEMRPRVIVANANYVVCCDGCKDKLTSHPEQFVKL